MSVPSLARRSGVLVAVLVLVLAACSGDDGASEDVAAPTATTPAEVDEPTSPATTEPPVAETTEPATGTATDSAMQTPAAGATGPAGAEGGAIVDVASTDLGDVLVDSEGMTLYLFTPDEGGESTCYDSCAENWPALTVDGEVTVGGSLDDSLFATVARDDGAQQATVDGWPLYLFAADSAPGDVNGQGVGDVWFAVTPSGEPVEG